MNKLLGTLVAALLALLAAPPSSQRRNTPQSISLRRPDLGTFGGPNNGVTGGAVIVDPDGVAVGEADTSDLRPRLWLLHLPRVQVEKGSPDRPRDAAEEAPTASPMRSMPTGSSPGPPRMV